jgi:carbonic anhydrase
MSRSAALQQYHSSGGFVMATAAVAGVSLARPGRLAAQDAAAPAPAEPVTPDAALQHLIEGNKRFAAGKSANPRRSPDDYRRVAEGQNPEVIVVSCSDSRVPPELVFDMGVGDLFVIRVAGNVVNGAGPAVKGSIEYGVAELEVPVILVLGHTNCGAVKAAIQHLDKKDSLPGAINDLVELVKPAVRKAKRERGDLLENAIRANVQLGASRLRSLDPIVGPLVKKGKVKVVGGVYDLATGTVNILD